MGTWLIRNTLCGGQRAARLALVRLASLIFRRTSRQQKEILRPRMRGRVRATEARIDKHADAVRETHARGNVSGELGYGARSCVSPPFLYAVYLSSMGSTADSRMAQPICTRSALEDEGRVYLRAPVEGVYQPVDQDACTREL